MTDLISPDRLYQARRVLADIAHHDDAALYAACDIVLRASSDLSERKGALRLRRILERTARATLSTTLESK